ncbi:MAG: monovalent cation/H+ antiporter subunit E [Rhodobacteraceae bacterium]|nr:monovalent cation/H+ antiporter subunit E [Paracoccaceae bacterium]
MIPSCRRPLVALRLLGVFLRDVVVANVEVARRILGPEAAIHSRFVWMPLTIESQQGKAVLAAMVTMTPGTLSVDITEDGHWLLVHAFNLDDEQALIAEIRQRYEAPLREIFR